MNSNFITIIISLFLLLSIIFLLFLIGNFINLPYWIYGIAIFLCIPLIWYFRIRVENKIPDGSLNKTKKLTKKYSDKYHSCPHCNQPVLKENKFCSYCGNKISSIQ